VHATPCAARIIMHADDARSRVLPLARRRHCRRARSVPPPKTPLTPLIAATVVVVVGPDCTLLLRQRRATGATNCNTLCLLPARKHARQNLPCRRGRAPCCFPTMNATTWRQRAARALPLGTCQAGPTAYTQRVLSCVGARSCHSLLFQGRCCPPAAACMKHLRWHRRACEQHRDALTRGSRRA